MWEGVVVVVDGAGWTKWLLVNMMRISLEDGKFLFSKTLVFSKIYLHCLWKAILSFMLEVRQKRLEIVDWYTWKHIENVPSEYLIVVIVVFASLGKLKSREGKKWKIFGRVTGRTWEWIGIITRGARERNRGWFYVTSPSQETIALEYLRVW